MRVKETLLHGHKASKATVQTLAGSGERGRRDGNNKEHQGRLLQLTSALRLDQKRVPFLQLTSAMRDARHYSLLETLNLNPKPKP